MFSSFFHFFSFFFFKNPFHASPYALLLLLLNKSTWNCVQNAEHLRNLNRHLARNPFICDCNLRWLADYLHKNPIETSGARCDAPKRMHRRRIEALRDEKFKCEFNLKAKTVFFFFFILSFFKFSCAIFFLHIHILED